MKTYKHLLTSILIIFLSSCLDNRTSPKTIEQKAIRITNRLNSSSINIFRQWNYTPRGKAEIWSRKSSDSILYNCIYIKFPDTTDLRVSQLSPFLKEFPLKIMIDTFKYWQVDFLKSVDNNVKIVGIDHSGKNHTLKQRVAITKLFEISNPFEKLSKLSKLKDSLEVFGITSKQDLGSFIQFYLSSEHILTYLPDNLNLNPQFKDVWLKEFATGKTIKKNWNLRKLPHPINGG